MDQLAVIALDLVAISILAFVVYFPRNRRRDLAVAFVGVNVGVLAVSMVLGSSTVGAGLGLGLFGVLSIIRLRSTEIHQTEVAYYFSALALGLIAGLTATPTLLNIGLMALVVAVMAVIDSPRLFRRYREQSLTLDRAYTDESVLRAELRRVLGAPVDVLTVTQLDLVNDTTMVDVRYRIPRERARSERMDAASRPDPEATTAAASTRALPVNS